MGTNKASVVLHCNDSNLPHLAETLKTICTQTTPPDEVLVLCESDPQPLRAQENTFNPHNVSLSFLEVANEATLGRQLNTAFKKVNSPFILYLDNRSDAIFLKQGAHDLFLLAAQRNPDFSLIYSDYELQQDSSVKEIHLLKHHRGRVRDNQDYGKVFFISRQALQEAGYADENLKTNTLYDLRLKLSEKHELVHIANRYAGSLYRAIAEEKSHNVFDYLLAGKESQLEAEAVLSGHLKRIGAYLEPGAHYGPRPAEPSSAELKASVIIPVNNRPDFIGTAIESVQAQTVKEVEAIIVVNGGYDDPTIDEVKRYMPGGDKYDENKPSVQLLVYEINNLGLCLNMGARAARGVYYVQLDSDDRLKPDAVEKILQVYESDPNIGMVIGSYEVWEKQPSGDITRMEDLPVVTHDEWTDENGRNNLLRINGAGAPRSIPIALIRQIGFSVNEEPFARNYGEDYNMVLFISERHRIGRVWEAIYEVIRHEGGTDHSIDQATIDRNDEAKDYMRLEAIQRRIKLNAES